VTACNNFDDDDKKKKFVKLLPSHLPGVSDDSASFRVAGTAAIITSTDNAPARLYMREQDVRRSAEVLRIKGEAKCVSAAFQGVIALVALDKTMNIPRVGKKGRN